MVIDDTIVWSGMQLQDATLVRCDNQWGVTSEQGHGIQVSGIKRHKQHMRCKLVCVRVCGFFHRLCACAYLPKKVAFYSKLPRSCSCRGMWELSSIEHESLLAMPPAVFNNYKYVTDRVCCSAGAGCTGVHFEAKTIVTWCSSCGLLVGMCARASDVHCMLAWCQLWPKLLGARQRGPGTATWY